jgi:hypothetical protein
MTSWKVEVLGVGEKTWVSNGLRFATQEEAQDSGFELSCRWFGMEDFRTAESEDAVNYRFEAGKNVRLEEPSASP